MIEKCVWSFLNRNILKKTFVIETSFSTHPIWVINRFVHLNVDFWCWAPFKIVILTFYSLPITVWATEKLCSVIFEDLIGFYRANSDLPPNTCHQEMNNLQKIDLQTIFPRITRFSLIYMLQNPKNRSNDVKIDLFAAVNSITINLKIFWHALIHL